MKLREIKAQPFAAFAEESRVRWKVVVKEPIVEGERLLVVDFLKNTACTAYQRGISSFRLICAKKGRRVQVIASDGTSGRKVLERSGVNGYDYIWITEREEERLRRFWGKKETRNHQLDNLLQWVRDTQKEMRRRERQKRGELMDEDVRLCPDTLPDGLSDYIRREVLPQDATLVYRRGNVQGRCYLCGQEVRAYWQRFRQNELVRCPNCGRAVLCTLEGGAAYRSDFVGNIVTVQKGTNGETVFFRQWQLQRDPSAQWESIEPYLKETVRYAIRGRHTAKWQREGKDNYYMHTERYELPDWTRWRGNAIYDGSYFFCTAGIEAALSGTAMQYADSAGYLAEDRRNKNPIYFLEYHQKYPVIEFLWKNGYRQIVHRKICGADRENRNAIYWQRTKLKECFKFPLRFLRLQAPEAWTLDDVARLNTLWKIRGEGLKEREIMQFLSMKSVGASDIQAALPYASVTKILHYIERQTMRQAAGFVQGNAWDKPPQAGEIAHTYRDYLQECTQLHFDLTQREILFPPDLDAAHERTMAQISFEKNKADQEKFQKAVDRLEKYAWENGDFLIRPAREQKELADEGTALHHCVGGYIKRMADGETAIFLLRRRDAPEQPYFTLELQNKKIVQCRTEHNKSYLGVPDVKNFVEMWMKEVVEKGGRKRRENAA